MSRSLQNWIETQAKIAYQKAAKGEYNQAILLELEIIRTILTYPKPSFYQKIWQKLKVFWEFLRTKLSK